MPDWFLPAWLGGVAGWLIGRWTMRIWFHKQLDKISDAMKNRGI